MNKRKICVLLTAVLLMFYIAGCADVFGSNTNNGSPAASLSYYYCYVDDTYVSNSLQQKMDAFGNPIYIKAASPKTEIYTEIPEVENNAKGTDPICIVLPELDLSKYSGPYISDDRSTGLEVSAYYRTVAGMLTDELVKVYIDSSGSIVQYETVNLGKYDNLNLDEVHIKSSTIKLRNAINKSLSEVTIEFYARTQIHAPSAYELFTDDQGQIVIRTTTVLRDDSNPQQTHIQADLYAVLN